MCERITTAQQSQPKLSPLQSTSMQKLAPNRCPRNSQPRHGRKCL
jgi:hypothetical protein